MTDIKNSDPEPMSAAEKLIYDIEARSGLRIEDPIAQTQLLGAVAREMGASKFGAKDDFVVGLLLQKGKTQGENDVLFALMSALMAK